MIVHKCDLCQKDMGEWYVISVSSDSPLLRKILKYHGFKMEICRKCLLDNISSVFVKEEYLEPSTVEWIQEEVAVTKQTLNILWPTIATIVSLLVGVFIPMIIKYFLN